MSERDQNYFKVAYLPGGMYPLQDVSLAGPGIKDN